MSMWAAIHEAVIIGDETKLDQLVLQGVPLDMLNEKNDHAVLHEMAYIGSKRGIELLIQRGANINVPQGKSGLTPLHIAASCEHTDLVQRLIELGANVHAKDSERPYGSASMALHIVAQCGIGSHESFAILKLLLHHGGASDLLIGNADGDTPLHCAALNSNPGIMRELVSISSTSSVINLPNHKGQTPLHLAVREFSGNIEAARLLLNAGATVDVRDAEGATPFHFAVGQGNLEAATLLLDAGAGIDACDAKGATPFHFAVGKCNLEAVHLLLNAGANRSIRDHYGATPFHYAARSGNMHVLDILNKENVDDPATENHLTALHYAAWNKRNEAVEWLLEHKASVDVMDSLKGDTPLHLAARRGDADVIQTLIQQGGADTKLSNKKGQLALGLADDRGHHDAAKAFVKAIREQNRQDRLKDSLWTKHSSNGATLLHYFAAYGAEEDMDWILKVIKRKMTSFDYKLSTDVRLYGGAVNIPDGSNRNAVHWAAMRGNTQALKSLAQNKADLNADVNVYERTLLCQTPLYFALIGEKKFFADELMKLKSENPNLRAQDWISDISKWMMEYYNQDANRKKLATLKEGFKKHKYPPNISDESLFLEIPPIYLALHAEREDIAIFIQQHRKGEDDAVNERGQHSGRTALHWATLLRQRKIVAQLCRKLFKDGLTANVEDKCKKTALQYAKEMDTENEIYKAIEKELMQRSDVTAHIDGLYKDRQVYVDAANAILVGAALIAGVTFAGWLQPPLGYANYYNLPKLSAPPTVDAYQSYAAIQQHGGVRWFWVFNGLSFSFAIATVLAGLVAVVPIPGIYIATSVAHLRKCLLIAAALLGSSIVFVLVAFAAAGFAVLPPFFKYQASMLGTTIVGAMPCVLLLTWFCCRLALLCPEWLLTINVRSMWKLICSSANNTCRFCHRSKPKTKGADFSELCVPLERVPAQIVVDSSPLFQASTSQASMREESTIRKQCFEFNMAVNSSMPEDDEDYIVGEDYDESPWNDGLNVTANIIPKPLTFTLS